MFHFPVLVSALSALALLAGIADGGAVRRNAQGQSRHRQPELDLRGNPGDVHACYSVLAAARADEFCSSLDNIHDTTKTVTCGGAPIPRL